MEDHLGKPEYVNDKGVKWWLDNDTTKYAVLRGLKHHICWITETPDGKRTRLLTANMEIVAEHKNLEAMGAKIDLLALGLIPQVRSSTQPAELRTGVESPL